MAMPVVSFIISGVVSFVSVQAVYIATGVIALVVTVALSKYIYLLEEDDAEQPEQITDSIQAEEDTTSQEAAEA